MIFILLFYHLLLKLRYRENPSFIEQIELLNANLNNNKSLDDMLKIIGITGYNRESIDKVKKSIDEFCDELYNDLESVNDKDNNLQK